MPNKCAAACAATKTIPGSFFNNALGVLAVVGLTLAVTKSPDFAGAALAWQVFARTLPEVLVEAGNAAYQACGGGGISDSAKGKVSAGLRITAGAIAAGSVAASDENAKGIMTALPILASLLGDGATLGLKRCCGRKCRKTPTLA